MIYLNFNIRHPRWAERFDNLWNKFGDTPFKNKHWEIQVIKNDNLLRLEFEVTTMQDHAGVNLELGLLGYEIHFTFYDNRHWNYKENRWYNYEENEYGS